MPKFSASLPLRERGLKSPTGSAHHPTSHVAPLAGAWIEILDAAWFPGPPSGSLPLRERGLKFIKDAGICGTVIQSLPLRERGLKSVKSVLWAFPEQVAPLAGAWIEIFNARSIFLFTVSLPLRERGLKLWSQTKFPDTAPGRSPCGSVD